EEKMSKKLDFTKPQPGQVISKQPIALNTVTQLEDQKEEDQMKKRQSFPDPAEPFDDSTTSGCCFGCCRQGKGNYNIASDGGAESGGSGDSGGGGDCGAGGGDCG